MLISCYISDMEIPKEALPSYYFEDSFDEGVDDMDILNAAVEVEKNLDLEVQKATNNIWALLNRCYIFLSLPWIVLYIVYPYILGSNSIAILNIIIIIINSL